jgi:hypothetical protein
MPRRTIRQLPILVYPRIMMVLSMASISLSPLVGLLLKPACLLVSTFDVKEARCDVPSTGIHSSHGSICRAELEACRIIWIVWFLPDTQYSPLDCTDPSEDDRKQDRAFHYDLGFELSILYN